jgi:hypothetical protein
VAGWGLMVCFWLYQILFRVFTRIVSMAGDFVLDGVFFRDDWMDGFPYAFYMQLVKLVHLEIGSTANCLMLLHMCSPMGSLTCTLYNVGTKCRHLWLSD